MIYLRNITDEQRILLPVALTAGEPAGVYTFELFSTVNREKVVDLTLGEVFKGSFDASFSAAFDAFKRGPAGETTGNYYAFNLGLPAGLPDGEYEYRLTNAGETIASGVVTVGDYTNESTEYNKDVTYEQYRG